MLNTLLKNWCKHMGEVNTQTWDMILSLLGHLVLGDANSNDQNLKDKVTLLYYDQYFYYNDWAASVEFPTSYNQIRISKTNTNNSEPLLCLQPDPDAKMKCISTSYKRMARESYSTHGESIAMVVKPRSPHHQQPNMRIRCSFGLPEKTKKGYWEEKLRVGWR